LEKGIALEVVDLSRKAREDLPNLGRGLGGDEVRSLLGGKSRKGNFSTSYRRLDGLSTMRGKAQDSVPTRQNSPQNKSKEGDDARTQAANSSGVPRSWSGTGAILNVRYAARRRYRRKTLRRD